MSLKMALQGIQERIKALQIVLRAFRKVSGALQGVTGAPQGVLELQIDYGDQGCYMSLRPPEAPLKHPGTPKNVPKIPSTP